MLNIDSKTKSKLVWLATLMAPVMAVQAARFVFGGSASPAPAAAAAVQPSVPGPTAAEPEKALTAEQLKAKNWLHSQSRTLHGRSPMDRADPTPVEVAMPSAGPSTLDAPPPQTPVVEGQPTGLALTGMIAGGTEGQSLASINHRVYRVGDTVVGSWKVLRVDTRKRMVTLTGPEGREMSLTPATPALER